MRTPSEAELLALWERGRTRHPIDRALLLGGFARPDLPSSRLPDFPLGVINTALLSLREASFGPRIEAYLDCERCGERLEFALDSRQLLAGTGQGDGRSELEVAGFRFRPPSSRDLAAVAGEHDVETASRKFLDRCRVDGGNTAWTEDADLRAEVEAGLEALDPMADIALELACEACGHRWVAGLDIGALLWEEIEARARALLTEVHRLARAYGWTEPEILALSPERRAIYLEMVDAS
jgi:hypothetical protein